MFEYTYRLIFTDWSERTGAVIAPDLDGALEAFQGLYGTLLESNKVHAYTVIPRH